MIPIRLRHQAWLAAVLLFSPWLAAFFLNAPLLRQRPVTALALLPGLAVAASVQHQLARHLRANHRPGEEDRLFPTLGAANWITLLRAAAVVSLAGLLPRALPGGNGLPEGLVWVPGVVYLGVALADLLDGMVARRRNRVSELGKRLDIATDAAGLLAASLLAVGLGRLPAVYLLVGLAYYPFIFGIWLRQKRGLPLIALQPRPYARIIAGFQMGLVAMALLPIFNPAFTFVAAWIFMTPLLAGFLRDWLVVSCRLQTDAGQKTALDRRVAILLARDLPLLLRLLVLVCGVATLAAGGVYQTTALLATGPEPRLPAGRLRLYGAQRRAIAGSAARPQPVAIRGVDVRAGPLCRCRRPDADRHRRHVPLGPGRTDPLSPHPGRLDGLS